MKTKFIAILMLVFVVSCVNAQSPKYENFDSPVSLLSSYYDAVNQKDFRRAYGYWKSPSASYENFARGYADTEKVRLIVEPPTVIEGAAGSLYTQVPTVLISTMKNGKQQMYSGCYTLQKSNLRPPDIPKLDVWHIYRASLKTASANSDIPQLLDGACAENTNTPDEKTGSRILGVLGFDSQTAEQSISIPATIAANKDFEITVTTSGNGCVRAADTGVILGENTADIFVYDFTTANRPGIVCTMILKSLSHKATLKFTKTGEAVIRVWGRKAGGNAPLGEPVVIEKRVTVR